MITASQAQFLIAGLQDAENAWNETSVGGLVAALKECSCSRDLERGKQLHTQAIYSGRLGNKYVASSLISFYSKCGCTGDARSVFDNLLRRDVVSCNALLQGYVDNGQSELALEVFQQMAASSWRDCSPNSRTFVLALAACAALAALGRSGKQHDKRIKWLEMGKEMHAGAKERQCCDVLVETGLIILYSKCSRMVQARAVFDAMLVRDVVSWNALLRGYVDNGENERALEIFGAMQEAAACLPDARTYVCVLAACAALGEKGGKDRNEWLLRGKRIHHRVASSGCCDKFVTNVLIDMYAKCGSMTEAKAVFDASAETCDIVSWTTLLHGYVHCGEHEVALKLFDGLRETHSGCVPVARTYVAALKACVNAGSTENLLEKGERIYSMAEENGCCDVYVKNTLIELHVKHGSMTKAKAVFDCMAERHSVSWIHLLHGYVQNGENETALDLFNGVGVEGAGDSRLYAAALMACTALVEKKTGDIQMWLDKGEFIFSRAVVHRCCNDAVKTGLVNMYVACKRFEDVERVLVSTGEGSTQAWNCLIRGYVENGENEAALLTITCMSVSEWDSVTLVQALTACGKTMDLESGKSFHAQCYRCGLAEEDLSLATSLVDFYGRCGRMDAAEQVFESITRKDTAAWNALLSGYSSQGYSLNVFDVYHQMKDLGVRPNEVTFLSVLVSCAHAGLTTKGIRCFEAMKKHHVTPSIKHYACLVDLYGRANNLESALKVIETMPLKPNTVIWQTLLAACTKWSNVVIGKAAYDSLLALGAQDEVPYVLMANLHSHPEEES